MFGFLKIWQQNMDSFKKYSSKNEFQQLMEICYYKLKGYSIVDYYSIPLFGEIGNRNLISQKKYAAYQKYLNHKHTGVIPFDKWIQSCFWKANQIPHATVFGFLKKNTGFLNGKFVENVKEELPSFFENQEFPLVIKPLDESNGNGFDRIENYSETRMELELNQMGTLDIPGFLDTLFEEDSNGYIIQTYIDQHKKLSQVYPNAVNTLRVVTHRDKNYKCSVDCALMKFGAGKSITDNNNVDGRIFSFMDMTTGCLKEGFTGAFSHEKVLVHPDSNVQIKDFQLPFWEDCLELAMTAHALLPYPRHLGWDIAISETGPLVVELNSFLASSVYQKGGQDLMDDTGFGRTFKEFI